MVRCTDHPVMTIAVDWDIKPEHTLVIYHISGSMDRPPDKSVYWKIIFIVSNQNICFGYSKEPSQ